MKPLGDSSNLLIPRARSSDGEEDVYDNLARYISSGLSRMPCYEEELWSLGTVARWVQERTEEAVDGALIDEERLLETLTEIHGALRSGELTAYAISSPEATSRPVPKETWFTYSLGYKQHLGFLEPVVVLHGSEANDTFGYVKLKRREVMRYWRAEDTRSVPPSTAGAEHECFMFLRAEMRASPYQALAKADVKAEAMAKFAGLSGRGFDRAWSRALDDTGAEAWSKPGRKT